MFFFLVTLLTVIILYKWLHKPHPSFPPGPLGVPLLGVIPYLSENFPKIIFEWSQSYGPVVAVKFPMETAVYLNTYEAVHEAFSKQLTKLSGRPLIRLFYQISNDISGIIAKDYGYEWKLQRRLGNKVFRGFLFGDKGFETIVQEEAEHTIKYLRRKVDTPLNFSLEIGKATANVISKVVIGRRFDPDDVRLNELLEGSEKNMGDPADLKLMQFCFMLPFLFHVPPFKYATQRFVDLHRNILALMKDFVEERQKNFSPDNIQCFVDSYLRERQQANPEDAALFTDKELHALVKDLYFAGIETSSHTLSWAILLLLHHPDCKKRLQDEIHTVVGHGTPSLKHKESMPYTCAFLHEVLRYRTIAPTGAPHMANCDAVVNGYLIPKGTTVNANIWAIHNDPKNWPQPDKFDPLRHIDDNGKFVASPKVVSFSLGQRRCLGELLAKSELFIFLVCILQHFDVANDPDVKGLPDLDGAMGGIHVPNKYKVVFQNRSEN